MTDASRRGATDATPSEASAPPRAAWNARRYAAWCAACVLVAFIACAHALDNGLYFDDWGVMNLARHGEFHAGLRSPAEERAYRVRARDEGWLPWYANLDTSLAIFRPLPIRMHVAEFRAFPERIDVMHAINIAWLGAAIVAVAWLVRRLTSSYGAAALAVLFYSVEEGHGAAVEWISARNVLMVAAFGAVALAAQDAWRRAAWRPGAWLCPLALALGFLSSEATFAVVAYLACHALILEEGPVRKRALGAAPWVAVTVAYFVYYKLAGYGVRGIGLYLDPIESPLQLLDSIAISAPALLVTKLLGAPTLAWPMLWSRLNVLLLLVPLTILFFPLVRRDRTLRFWGAGLVLAQIPVATTGPQTRFFLVTALGGSVLVAELIARCHPARLAARSRPFRLAAYALALAFATAHGPISAMSLAGGARINGYHDARTLDRIYARGEEAIRDVRPDQRVVIVSAPLQVGFGTGLSMRRARGEPRPLSSTILLPAIGRGLLRRHDERTLVLAAEHSFFGGDWHAYRSAKGFVGESAALHGMTATVTDVAKDGYPKRVRFEFDRPLEDAAFAWREWRDGRFVEFVPPPIDAMIAFDTLLE